MSVFRVSLTELDFRALVSGGEIALRNGDTKIEIVLSDIGFRTMLRALVECVSESERMWNATKREQEAQTGGKSSASGNEEMPRV